MPAYLSPHVVRPDVVVAALITERAVTGEVIRTDGGLGRLHGVAESALRTIPTSSM